MRLSRDQIVSFGVLVLIAVFVVLTIPGGKVFDEPLLVEITDGMSMTEAAMLLEESGIVHSDILVRLISFVLRTDTGVKAGSYLFEGPVGSIEAVLRLAQGDYGISEVRVQLPEGSTKEQMAEILDEALVNFDALTFLSLTADKEGYLFPDTYFFLATDVAEDVAVRLEETFFERMERLEPMRIVSGRSLEEIVIMASIIEREAYKEEDQYLISGVLWNRFEIGMALQVDATLYYLLGKPSRELTKADLETDSPYNTYEYPGLPPGPISNPGIVALEAAINPTPSSYFYYLSDSEGNTYYAEDFDGHQVNRELHL